MIHFARVLLRWREKNFTPGILSKTLSNLVLVVLLIATGGWLFTWIGMPLPWLLGPACISILCILIARKYAPHKNLVTAILHAIQLKKGDEARSDPALALPKLEVPGWLHASAFLLLAVQIGATLTPDHLRYFISAPQLFAAMFFASLLAMLSAYWLFRFLGRWSHNDAILASFPGAFSVTLGLSRYYPCNISKILASHLTRFTLLFFIAPLLFSARLPTPDPEELWSVTSHCMILSGAAFFALVLRRFPRLMPFFLMPALFVGVLSMSGWISGSPHPALFNLGLAIFAVHIGVDLTKQNWSRWRLDLPLALLSAVLMISITSSIALLAAKISGQSNLMLILAYAPGGLEAMLAISLALDTGAAFVAASHLFRMFSISLLAPMVCSRFAHKSQS